MACGAQAPPNQLWFYQSKDGKMEKTFDALEWLAAMTSHVPNLVAPMVSISVKIVSGVKQSGILDTAIFPLFPYL